MASLRPAQLIPRRIMTVVAKRAERVMEDGTRATVKVAWVATCLSCHWHRTFGIWQHSVAVSATRSHDCYAKKG